ncbi:hypothetical protein ACFQ1E_17605 [Sphingomonas canadensis]|uniref:Uncharacterized protein n=1 Tax=Sphingomonas canadensis TaxID=1219257 RepID=A0ABW3HAG8_9SPHN|nr:hypothetical protein [Sphingomonas canadensis]MCW3837863.1 hypothetical protein [Sphingomonas canadensis]
MDLLLILTAILASLTGGATGDRAGSLRQVQGVAVVQAAEAVQAAVQPVRAVTAQAALPALRPQAVAIPARTAAPPAALRLPFERRLE